MRQPLYWEKYHGDSGFHVKVLDFARTLQVKKLLTGWMRLKKSLNTIMFQSRQEWN